MILRILCCSFICFFALLLAGCNSPAGDFVEKSEKELAAMEVQNDKAHKKFLDGNYENAINILNNIGSERTVSQPLYQLEKLSVLLMDGKFEEAHKEMLLLHQDFETLFDEKSEEKAQSIWHGEVNKVYKGDSYERSTFYALLAMSFIRKQEYEDAVRCVKNGLLADGDSNNEDALDDYALLHYLGYFASKKMNNNDDAEEYLQSMYKALGGRGLACDENGKPIGSTCLDSLKNADANVFLVVWAGMPPTVVKTGEYEEIRSIISGKNYFDALSISIGPDFSIMMPNNLGDVNYQATTRGGRMMDNVLADKALAKKGMAVTRNVFFIVGSSLVLAGAQTMSNPALGISLMGAGGCCFLFGTGFWIAGYYMNPEADGRYWRNLPGQFYLIPLKLPVGQHKIACTGFWRSDRVALSTYDINVTSEESVNIIHLPMMNCGGNAASIINKKLQKEYNTASSLADSDRYSKELK